MSNKPQRRPNNTPSSISVTKTELWAAPLPHPEILREYNEIIPGGAERILAMAESQSQHRMGMEDRALTANLVRAGRGQWFGFIISMVALAIGAYGLYNGHEIGGGIIGGGGLTALVSLFVIGKRGQSKEVRRNNPTN